MKTSPKKRNDCGTPRRKKLLHNVFLFKDNAFVKTRNNPPRIAWVFTVFCKDRQKRYKKPIRTIFSFHIPPQVGTILTKTNQTGDTIQGTKEGNQRIPSLLSLFLRHMFPWWFTKIVGRSKKTKNNSSSKSPPDFLCQNKRVTLNAKKILFSIYDVIRIYSKSLFFCFYQLTTSQYYKNYMLKGEKNE